MSPQPRATAPASSPACSPAVEPSARSGLGRADLADLEREAALSELFHRHHTSLVRLATLMGADEEAEDIVAEAFCELHRRWRRLRDPGAALAYVRAAVCNFARMRLRHLEVERRYGEPRPTDVESAESAVMLREDHRQVVAALHGLPFRQRQAIVLRYWMDLREVDVAAAMGISLGAVKSHISRAMAALERALGGA